MFLGARFHFLPSFINQSISRSILFYSKPMVNFSTISMSWFFLGKGLVWDRFIFCARTFWGPFCSKEQMQQGSLDPQLFQPGISSDGLSSAALMPTVAIHDAFCAFSTNTCTMALFLPSIESPSASSKRSPLPNCPKPTKASIGTTIGHAWTQRAPKCPTSSGTCAESKTLLSLPGPPKFSKEYRFLVDLCKGLKGSSSANTGARKWAVVHTSVRPCCSHLGNKLIHQRRKCKEVKVV